MTDSEDVQNEPSLRRPQQRGQATRGRLFEAAATLFGQKGYDGTSIGDIAQRAGVGVGTVYHHFTDKRAILLELIDVWAVAIETQQRSSGMERAFIADPRTAINGFLTGLFAAMRSQPSLFGTALAVVDRDPEVAQRYRKIELQGVQRMLELIELGQRHGLVRHDLDARQAAILITHTVDSTATRVVARSEPGEDDTAVAAELAEMICRYILNESSDDRSTLG